MPWSVLQYVIIRPLVSIVGIICEKLHVLCESAGYSIYYASVYLECVDFVSISVALYGLLVFYGLMADELRDRRPLAKFLCIKLIVMFTFYQSFVVSKSLPSCAANLITNSGSLGPLKEELFTYWTATNISNGLNALAICIEMVFFSALMMWAYTPAEYQVKEGAPPTSIWRPLWDSINFSDFAHEIYTSLQYFFGKKPQANHGDPNAKMDFGQAFGVTSSSAGYMDGNSTSEYPLRPSAVARPSYDEHLYLAPNEAAYGTPNDPYGVAFDQQSQGHARPAYQQGADKV
ncbi:hypothetical protein H0H81_006996 [Sphagnurus paluster]|uniref:Uncharacterized protein n=1 Tax=Sphagnurus paluster TaxID=117069 RepID=A0A9P7FUX3_9AGAR|nr:hypothetical protein H0H81_006996 [Sphagnurus paluster]